MFEPKPEYFDNFDFYYINMDKSTARRKQMEDNAPVYLNRIKAFDAKWDEFYIPTKITKSDLQENIGSVNSPSEYGCTCSHLKAIKTFYQSDKNQAVILEDDIDWEVSNLWSEPLYTSISKLPNDWDICLLYNSHQNDVDNINFVIGKHWGTVAYAISRKGAEKILQKIKMKGHKYDFSGVEIVSADHYIYGLVDNIYVYNRFFCINQDSNIHSDHVDFHKKIKEIGVKNLIKQFN